MIVIWIVIISPEENDNQINTVEHTCDACPK